jgi:hypothetical protein
MIINKKLEKGFIRAIQKRSSKRTKKGIKAINIRNEFINQQFEWSTQLDEKLVLINNRLQEEEKKVFIQYQKIEKQCKLMVYNKEIKDFNIEVVSDYWNNKHYKKYDPEVYGNPFYKNTWDSFMGSRQIQEEYDNYCSNTVNERCFIPKDSLIANANHCYSFHHLYDHTDLTWFDIYNIDKVWMEIKVEYQFFSNIKKRIK